MEKGLNEYFSELNLTKLKEFAAKWARWHPVIEKILLFEQDPLVDEESKYILVAVIPHLERPLKIKEEYKKNRKRVLKVLKAKNLSRKRALKEIEGLKNQEKEKFENLSEEERMAVRVWNWSSPDCLHVQSALEKAYVGTRRQDVIGRWMWLHAFNPKIEETDIAASVIHESQIVLYEKYHGDQAPQEREQAEAGSKPPFEHSSDFRSVFYSGKKYILTPRQAQVIQILYEAWENKTPDVGKDTILEELGTSSSRLRDTFRSNPPARKDLIRSDRKGTVRLNIP